MKPDKLSVYQLFETQRRHVVPLYQRPYVWDQERHWEPLWDDILRQVEAAGRQDKKRPHFLGAVVLNQLPSQSKEIDSREIIDGQQRLTTIQVFLAAARRITEREGDERLHGEFTRLTVNPLPGENADGYKIRPTKADQDVFSTVMEALSTEELNERFSAQEPGRDLPKLAEAYLFFLNQLEAFLISEPGQNRSDRLWDIHTALRDRLQFVVIDLDDTDDPQVIFETLNARGVPLLPSDLIRNFVLHRARFAGLDIDALYEKWWQNFDERQDADASSDDDRFWKKFVRQGRMNRPRLDLFFFHFLQYRTFRDFNITRLYQEFCEWWDSCSEEGIEHVLGVIRRDSETFSRFMIPGNDGRVDLFLHRLKILDTSTIYPALLAMLGPDAGWAGVEERDSTLEDLESFLVRRTVCRLTTKNYNKFFMSLLRALKEDGISREVVRSKLLASNDVTARWPDDDEFRRAWMQLPAYGYTRQDRIRMILEAIEMHLYSDRQERLGLDSQTTIEHVMPQKWQTSWRLSQKDARAVVSEDGETGRDRRDRLLQTYGNLTLLTQKLNSAVSNGTFAKKRRKIVKQSVLKLNTYFLDIDTWDEETIMKRGALLFDFACKVWPHPEPRGSE